MTKPTGTDTRSAPDEGPTDAEINEHIDKIAERLANCPTCRTSRQRWRAAIDTLRAAVNECCGFDNPPCRACKKLHEARHAWGIADIFTLDAHPHTEKIMP